MYYAEINVYQPKTALEKVFKQYVNQLGPIEKQTHGPIVKRWGGGGGANSLGWVD